MIPLNKPESAKERIRKIQKEEKQLERALKRQKIIEEIKEDLPMILIGGLPTALYVAFSASVIPGIMLFLIFLFGYSMGKESGLKSKFRQNP